MRILSGIAVAFCFAAIAVHPIRAQQGQASPLYLGELKIDTENPVATVTMSVDPVGTVWGSRCYGFPVVQGYDPGDHTSTGWSLSFLDRSHSCSSPPSGDIAYATYQITIAGHSIYADYKDCDYAYGTGYSNGDIHVYYNTTTGEFHKDDSSHTLIPQGGTVNIWGDGRKSPAQPRTDCFVPPPPPLSVTISGPGSRNPGQMGTWTANPSGGVSPYHYVWWRMTPCSNSLSGKHIVPNSAPCDQWVQFGGDNQQVTTYGYQDFELRVRVTDNTSAQAYAEFYVWVGMSKSVASNENLAGWRSNAIEEGAQILPGDAHNFPNPFNPTTMISFELPQSEHVVLRVFDSMGREITKLVDETLSPGMHAVLFDASGFSSGLYFYQITGGSFSKIQKMTLVK